jgi:hypothetical protein
VTQDVAQEGDDGWVTWKCVYSEGLPLVSRTDSTNKATLEYRSRAAGMILVSTVRLDENYRLLVPGK